MTTDIHSTMVTELGGLRRVYPVLELTIDSVVYRFAGSAVVSISEGFYKGYVTDWGPITRSIDLANHTLQTAEFTVSIADPERTIQKGIGGSWGGKIIGSAAKIVLRADDATPVSAANHYTIFDGIIGGYRPAGDQVWTFVFKPDDIALSFSTNTLRRIDTTDFPLAPQDSIGLPGQVVYGTHSSAGVTGSEGLVKTIPVDLTSTNEQFYISVGHIQSLLIVYVTESGTTTDRTADFSLQRVIINGRFYSLVQRDTGAALADDATIDVDCTGVTSLGTGSGTLIDDPIIVLENFLPNFVFATYPDDVAGIPPAWIPRSSVQINTGSFDTAGAFTAARGHTVNAVITSDDKGIDVLNGICKEYGLYPFWAYDWKLGVLPDDFAETDIYIDSRHIREDLGHALGPLTGDVRSSQIKTRIDLSYFLDQSTGQLKFSNSVEDTKRSPKVVASARLPYTH